MNFKLIIFVILLILAGFAGYRLFNNFLSSSLGQNNLIIGTAAGYAPFVSVNEKGEYEGFDIDVANALAQRMGKKLVIKDLGSMAPLFIALEQGSIDAIIWGLSITQDRLKKVAMVPYQGEITTSYPLIFWKKIPVRIKRIEDMKGMTVCAEPASSQDAVLNKYPFINKKSTEKVDDSLLNIQYGKADAALVEPAIAKRFKAKYPEIQILNVSLSPEDQVQGVGIAIKKENKQLIENVQRAIQDLQKSGIINKYQQKWGIE